jgi:hypothetical protein
VWQAASNYTGCLALLKFIKKYANGHYYLLLAAKPDQITQQNSL